MIMFEKFTEGAIKLITDIHNRGCQSSI